MNFVLAKAKAFQVIKSFQENGNLMSPASASFEG